MRLARICIVNTSFLCPEGLNHGMVTVFHYIDRNRSNQFDVLGIRPAQTKLAVKATTISLCLPLVRNRSCREPLGA